MSANVYGGPTMRRLWARGENLGGHRTFWPVGGAQEICVGGIKVNRLSWRTQR